MKRINIFYLLAFSLITVVTSCEKGEEPTINNLEIGINNSHIGYLGNDLHLEADILAEAKVDNIRILIHQEDEDEDKSVFNIEHSEVWEYDSTYTGVYAGVKSPTFHEHIDIPGNVEEGEYHFHIYVTDMEGYQVMVEEEIEIISPDGDDSYPAISVTSAPAENEIFASGNTISISGTVSDVQGLAGIYIGIVNENDGLADSDVSATNTITILHNHDFDDANEYSFESSIQVGAEQDNNITPKDIIWESGNYYILIKVPGIDGEVTFSEHYPITINVD